MSKSMESEQHLIACALIDDTKTAEILEINEDWFSVNAHKLIIRTIRDLATQSLSADIFAIADELERKGQLAIVGNMSYLTELAESLPNIKFWDSYKNSLFHYYKMRMIEQLNQNVSMQIGTGAKPQEIIEYLQSGLIDLLTDHHTAGLEKLSKHLDGALEYIEWKQNHEGAVRGAKSGYAQLDYALDGFQDGLMYAICARPAMGKTMFALSIANQLAKNVPVCYFSLEMTGSMLSQRLISAESKVSSTHFKQGTMSNDQNNDVAMAVTRLHELSMLHIDESAGLSVSAIRSRLKAFQIKTGKVGAIFIDHIGLIKKPKGAGLYDGLTTIIHELQVMAKEFNCPLIIVSQLNRNCDSRSDRRPVLSDIRETGAIEEDCRAIMFVYRDEYYEKDNSKQKNITEIILGKNTMGETGSFYFHHDLSVGIYEQITDYSAPEPATKGKF